MYESDAQKNLFHSTRALLIQSNAIRIKERSRHISKTHRSLGLQKNDMFVYLDDIVIYASSLAKNQTKFNKFSERLRQANLKLQPDKCEFLQKKVNYLGYVIGKDRIKPDLLKVLAVKEFLRPQTSKNIKQFLGLAGYYRFYIKLF